MDGGDCAVQPLLQAYPSGVARIASLILVATGLAAALPGANPADAATSGETLYVTDDENPSAVVPVPLSTLTAGSPITPGSGSFSFAIAISPDAGRAFSTNEAGPPSISSINTAANTASLVTNAKLTSPGSIAVSPDGSRLYVGNVVGNTVAVVNAHTLAVDPSAITVGNEPEAIAFVPDGRFAYVANTADRTVSVIDTSSKTVTKTITLSLPLTPCALAATPDGAEVVVVGGCGSINGGVSIIDTATNIATAIGPPLGTDSYAAAAMAPDGKWAYVYDSTTGDIWKVDPKTGDTPGSAFVTGQGGIYGLASAPDGSALFATRLLSASVSKIDTTDGAITPISPVTPKPWGDAVTPDQAPRAALSATAAPPGRASTFSAAGTSTYDGGPASYAWTFGDGHSATTTTPSVSHRYAHARHYTATVRVIDDQGCSTKLVYTGQTASCNGGATAKAKVALTVSKRPNTKITSAKINANKGKAKFTFRATGRATGFECRLKSANRRAKKFKRCSSPKPYTHLKKGKYTFKVRAVGPGGFDRSPAKRRFKIRS